jgi:hypothetical protein
MYIRPLIQFLIQNYLKLYKTFIFSKKRKPVDRATKEVEMLSQKLMGKVDSDMRLEIIKQRKTNSAELMKHALERYGKSDCPDYITKVNMAMCVLYARKLLTTLMAHWPEGGQVISASMLGCKDVQQIPCVLELLNKSDTDENFQIVSYRYNGWEGGWMEVNMGGNVGGC